MAADDYGMETYAARLASFAIVHSAPTKRGSDARGTKALKWPHKFPTPDQLAAAGFFFRPSVSNPDNATCFLCGSSLDGWEEGDDAIAEHLKHSPECGWVINVTIERQVSKEGYEIENPLTEKLLDARKMTFGSSWPHENKRGWFCKTQKLIEAGWYYCPTLESEDYVKCSYCSLSLDGWERKDNPYDEHLRRSPDCIFFSFTASVKQKPGRPRKSHTSKASRLSSQSDFTTISEGMSGMELDVNRSKTASSPQAEVEKHTTTARETKKGGRSKKTATRPKTKATSVKADESTLASSLIEPEDDDFEVKVDTLPIKNGKTKKRSSDEMNDSQNSENSLAEKAESRPPPAKRRDTRSRSSVMQVNDENISFSQHGNEFEANVTDAEMMPPPPAPVSKKGAKRGRKRASSRVRNVSATSTASMASLRSTIPDDDDIDAALEAELDRPLTDDEIEEQQPQVQLPKTRRLTRTKPSSRNVTASTARVRRTTRATSTDDDGLKSRDHDVSMQDLYEAELAETKPGVLDGNTKYEVSSLSREKEATIVDLSREATSDPKASQNTGINNGASLIVAIPQIQPDLAPARPKGPRNRQPSRKLSARNTSTSLLPDSGNAPLAIADRNSAVIISHAGEDDSGHEADASIVSQAPKKRGGKKGFATSKKTKGGKKVVLVSHNIEDIIQPGIETAEVGQKDDLSHATMDPIETLQPQSLQVHSVEKSSRSEKTKTYNSVSKESSPTRKASPNFPESVEHQNTQSRSQSMSLTEDVEDRVSPSNPTGPLRESTPPQVELPAGTPQPLHSVQNTPPPLLSAQSSDAENHPPSSRPSATRPPLSAKSPFHTQFAQIPSAACTPTASAPRRDPSRLQSTDAWRPVDLEQILLASPTDAKENAPFDLGAALDESVKEILSSPEKMLNMEAWVRFKARELEEKLRGECERLVGKFEKEGVRALRSLEGISCVD